MSDTEYYARNGIGYNSESEADLADEIPLLYTDGTRVSAGWIAEAVIGSEWLAAHDAELTERVRAEQREADARLVEEVEPYAVMGNPAFDINRVMVESERTRRANLAAAIREAGKQ
jgi:hypothetical protein